MKLCSYCKVEKPFEEFHADKRAKSGRCSRCKACSSIISKKWQEDNRDRYRARLKRWNEENKDRQREKKRQYRESNLERIRENDRRYYEANKERLCQYQKEYRAANLERIREQKRRYREENRDWILEQKRKHYLLNRERLLFIGRKYQKENRARRRAYWHSYKHRPGVKIGKALRSVLNEFFRKAKQSKKGSTHEILGYTPDQLRQRMECQFKPGMTWENHGEWHIDHKIPISHFLKKGETRPHIVNALSNLQPLWAEENMSKKDKHPVSA